MTTCHQLVTVVMLCISATLVSCNMWYEEHLIPQGYEGPVVILFGAENGSGDVSTAVMAKYPIPASGVLLLSEGRFRSGLSVARYFYVDKSGEKSRLPKSVGLDQVQIFAEEVGYRPGTNLSWIVYIVGRPGNREDWGIIRDKALDRVVDEAHFFSGDSDVESVEIN